MAKAKVEDQVTEEEINIDTEELNKEVEQPEVTEFPYDSLIMSIAEHVKPLGQLMWINDNKTADDDTSKTISIVRNLTNGKKQMFSITIEQNTELVFR